MICNYHPFSKEDVEILKNEYKQAAARAWGAREAYLMAMKQRVTRLLIDKFGRSARGICVVRFDNGVVYQVVRVESHDRSDELFIECRSKNKNGWSAKSHSYLVTSFLESAKPMGGD